MIYKLRRRLIWISGLSVVLVFIIIYAGISVLSANRLNNMMDMLTDGISPSDGRFPIFNEKNPPPPSGFAPFITEETPFSTRFFTVRYDLSGRVIAADVEFIASVTDETAREYAEQAVRSGKERGWIEGYRYKISDTHRGRIVVFVDGTMNRSFTRTLLLVVGIVLLCSLALILVLIILFSKRGVKPIAESYEKQKQFITDVNHELKTPLTLILANLDIIEADIGKNEWVDDIRAEGKRMNALVKQLVMLTRMDEEKTEINVSAFSLSDAVNDTVSEFRTLAEERRKPIYADVRPGVTYTGDEAGIRRVISILLDNALKYCDEDGNISLSLSVKRHPVIRMENTFAEVDNIELDKLFDRFYRADKARTFTGCFGIGLSIAKAIVEKHHGEIRAYKTGQGRIGFRVALK
ncbi:MAG: HAMP domain-containing histidine kinase [Clostridiaceae bacterium]|nr:HAMP domain-containing histidine kinase [Clostridiaceae bacterium]